MRDKYLFRTIRIERIAFAISAIIIALILAFILSSTVIPKKTVIRKTSVSFTPSYSLFGLTYLRGIVYSYYGDEASLIGYHYPVADIDYMLPYAAQERITLPGDSRDRYFYLGSVYIPGSGYVEEWEIAGNGARFSFLHVSSIWATVGLSSEPAKNYVKLLNLPSPNKCLTRVCSFAVGDENTVKVLKYIQQHAGRLARASGYYYGGQVVGTTGWPSSYTYSNGSCYDFVSCEYDAHLCFVPDQGAVNYFEYITYRGPIPKPKPRLKFTSSLWNYYRYHHHKKLISAYYHHKLSYGATLWTPHQKVCRGVVSKSRWYPVGYKGRHGYVYQRWQGCSIYFWPHLKSYHPKIVRERKYLS